MSSWCVFPRKSGCLYLLEKCVRLPEEAMPASQLRQKLLEMYIPQGAAAHQWLTSDRSIRLPLNNAGLNSMSPPLHGYFPLVLTTVVQDPWLLNWRIWRNYWDPWLTISYNQINPCIYGLRVAQGSILYTQAPLSTQSNSKVWSTLSPELFHGI